MGSALASNEPILKLARTGPIGHGGSFWHLLIEATPAAHLLAKPCHIIVHVPTSSPPTTQHLQLLGLLHCRTLILPNIASPSDSVMACHVAKHTYAPHVTSRPTSPAPWSVRVPPPFCTVERAKVTAQLGPTPPQPAFMRDPGSVDYQDNPLLLAKQSQLPQPLLIRLLLQTFHQLRCPSLDTLQHLNVPLVVGGPKLNTAFEVRPHQCRVQGHDHIPSPAGHAIFDTSQDAIGFLGRLGTLLAHIQPAVNQHPQVLLCQAAFQPLFPKAVALHGVAVAQVHLALLNLIQLTSAHRSSLSSLPPLKQINTPTQLGVICKLTEGALDPFVQIIDKDIKQNWPQHRALGNTACDRPPTGVNSIHHHSLGPAVQPVLYPAKSTPVQAMSSQFLQENAVGNRVKGFTEV
ncbi:hypothetical protein QYF61_018604 [Mycteria americana]|uniref:Uncharacterized protein n=1 Tax=Mycteria americana TaxID=33587 RepID=A0AAN7NUG9_MYCAM|nr:hypothetical protein QYF61_018604 [Mycteria americana]